MSAANRLKTHCYRGHELSGENLVRSQLENASIRNCRTCWNANARARRRRNSTLRAYHRCRGPLTVLAPGRRRNFPPIPALGYHVNFSANWISLGSVDVEVSKPATPFNKVPLESNMSVLSGVTGTAKFA